MFQIIITEYYQWGTARMRVYEHATHYNRAVMYGMFGKWLTDSPSFADVN